MIRTSGNSELGLARKREVTYKRSGFFQIAFLIKHVDEEIICKAEMKYSDLMYAFCQRGNCLWRDLILGRLEIPLKRGESGSGGRSTAFQLGESLSRLWLTLRPCLTPHLAFDHFYWVIRRLFFFLFMLLAQVSIPTGLGLHTSLCLSTKITKKYLPGFVLCWLDRLEHAAPRHLFFGLGPS